MINCTVFPLYKQDKEKERNPVKLSRGSWINKRSLYPRASGHGCDEDKSEEGESQFLISLVD